VQHDILECAHLIPVEVYFSKSQNLKMLFSKSQSFNNPVVPTCLSALCLSVFGVCLCLYFCVHACVCVCVCVCVYRCVCAVRERDVREIGREHEREGENKRESERERGQESKREQTRERACEIVKKSEIKKERQGNIGLKAVA